MIPRVTHPPRITDSISGVWKSSDCVLMESIMGKSSIPGVRSRNYLFFVSPLLVERTDQCKRPLVCKSKNVGI